VNPIGGDLDRATQWRGGAVGTLLEEIGNGGDSRANGVDRDGSYIVGYATTAEGRQAVR